MKRRIQPKDIIFYIAVIIVLIAAIWVLFSSAQAPEASYYEVYHWFKSGFVTEMYMEGDTLSLKLQDGTVAQYTEPNISWLYNDLGDTIREQMESGQLVRVNRVPGYETPWWAMFIPYVLIIALFLGVWFFLMNRAGGGSGGGGGAANKFGKAHARVGSDEKRKITFGDVAGAEEEKEELQEIVEFLKNPAKFTAVGARIPKGVLLVGPPGTGKTYLARAVAGEAGVQFLSISGSDFVELYVGVGASRVRDLFEQAKKSAPSIVFIDEIDAVGRHRGAGTGGGHDEREQTLNQLLVEMDGFSGNEGIIVMAATNRQDILDPALLRPGRFDRQVYVGLPDVREREAVLRIHSRNKPLDASVDLKTLAKTCGGFSPADLENLLNEAALLAVRADRQVITNEDLEEAMLKVVAGPAKKSRVVSDKERRLTAYHEAGHAVVMKCLVHHDPVHQISIIPRGMAGGMTVSLPDEDKNFMSRSEMFENIVSLLGGRVAEKLVLDDISTGASNDIERATDIARKMVTRYGMSEELGPIAFGSEHDEVFLGRDFAQMRNYSEAVAARIDAEIKRIIDAAYLRCEQILNRELMRLHGVAGYLLEYETMDSEAFDEYFDTGILTPPGGGMVAPKQAMDDEPPSVFELPEMELFDEAERDAQAFVDELFARPSEDTPDDGDQQSLWK